MSPAIRTQGLGRDFLSDGQRLSNVSPGCFGCFIGFHGVIVKEILIGFNKISPALGIRANHGEVCLIEIALPVEKMMVNNQIWGILFSDKSTCTQRFGRLHSVLCSPMVGCCETLMYQAPSGPDAGRSWHQFHGGNVSCCPVENR